MQIKAILEIIIPSLLFLNIISSTGALANYSDFQAFLALAQQPNTTEPTPAPSDNATLQPPPVNETTIAPPIADAGGDQTLSEGKAVQLNGSVSREPEGRTLSYVWNQTSGTPVTLSDASSATPTFTAPDVGANGDTLTFELTVNNTDGQTANDTVNVNVSDDGASVNQDNLINEIFRTYLPHVFIIIVFLVIIVPLVLDMMLAYRRTPTESSTSKRALGMPGLNRSLMTFGIIILLGTVIFYLLALITLNMNNATSPAFQSLIDLLRNLGIILGTALATIIAFYFGVRGSESAVEKAAAAVTEGISRTRAPDDKVPPKVLSVEPADGASEVPRASLITATFSEPMSIGTINSSTFTVRKEGEPNPLEGVISFSLDAKTVRLDADKDLDPKTKYTAEISKGAKDVAGNALVSAERWSFTTAPAPGPIDSGGKEEKKDDGVVGTEEVPGATTTTTRTTTRTTTTSEDEEDEDEYEYEKEEVPGATTTTAVTTTTSEDEEDEDEYEYEYEK